MSIIYDSNSRSPQQVVKDTTEPVYDEEFEYDDLPPARMTTMQVCARSI